jgi:hypothetical protein
VSYYDLIIKDMGNFGQDSDSDDSVLLEIANFSLQHLDAINRLASKNIGQMSTLLTENLGGNEEESKLLESTDMMLTSSDILKDTLAFRHLLDVEEDTKSTDDDQNEDSEPMDSYGHDDEEPTEMDQLDDFDPSGEGDEGEDLTEDLEELPTFGSTPN